MEFLPVLEMIDRLCIARVKSRRTNGANEVERAWYEVRYQELQKQVNNVAELEFNIAAMTSIHEAIWELEWELKSGVEQQLSLEEIGRRAIRIRDYNNKRISFKNSIAALVDSDPVREIKSDHLSDGTVDTK
jgi:hypothetical protein